MQVKEFAITLREIGAATGAGGCGAIDAAMVRPV